MKLYARLLSLLALVTLTACGGGGGSAGTSPLVPAPGTGASAVSDLVLVLASPTVANTDKSGVVATVTALDVNRNTVASAPVTLSADSDAVVTINSTAGSVTNSVGVVSGTVTLGANRNNRIITVTATSGSISKTASLQVVDGTGSVTPAAIDVIGSATTAGTGGDVITISAFVKDKNNNALGSVPVAFAADSGTLSGASTATNSQGLATASFSAGTDKSNRTAKITVTAGLLTGTLSIPITGTRLSLSGPSSLTLGNSANFDVVVTDSKSNVVPGVLITASSTVVTPAGAKVANGLDPKGGATTSANGQVRFAYTATNPGNDTLVFSGAGATVSPSPALVISDKDFVFISPAASALVDVNSDQLIKVRLRSGGAPTPGQSIAFASTGGTLLSSTDTDADGIASVTLRSASAGPVTVQASFSATANGITTTTTTTLPLTIVAKQPSQLVLQANPTAIAPNTGVTSGNQAQITAKVTDAAGNPVQGLVVNFSRVSDPSGGNLLQATATTDANGQASVAYRSGAQSTATNGVSISATVANSPTVSGTATLTVNQSALFIALGTGNTISNLDPQTYKKDWVLYVTDANGIPLNGATLTVKAVPTHYLTGQLVWGGKRWDYDGNQRYCLNEDQNANGVLDAQEDINGDGILWPGNVISVSPGSVQTANGLATISLVYAESYVPWVRLKLTATASVAGTESKTSVEFIVDGASPDFTVEAIPPAGVVSPFGLVPKGGATSACRLSAG